MGIGISACKKSFLDVTPKSYLVASKTSDYDNLLNTPGSGAGTELFVPLGDECIAMAAYISGSSLRDQRLFKWSDVIFDENEDDPTTPLRTQLYKYNKIIIEVDGSTGGSDQLKANIKAEAMANRAWIYYYLLNAYTKPYNPETAQQDLGYPIITTADVTINKFVRSPLKEVYDFVINDLTTAIPNIPLTQYTKNRMCRSAAEALLAKIYQSMGEHEAALIQLNNAFAHLPVAFGNSGLALFDLNFTLAIGGPWGYTATSNQFWYFGTPTGVANTEILFDRSISNVYAYFNFTAMMAPFATKLYQPGDMRLSYFGNEFGVDYVIPEIKRRVGPLLANNGIDLPELYLMRAECKARTGDAGGARTDLFELRKKRMGEIPATVPSNLTDKALIQFVLDERIREYAVTGKRWLDMRRLSVDPLFSADVYRHDVVSETGTITSTTLRKERLTLRFPPKVMAQNPEMENNP